jgi:hypothetical protein
VHAADRAAVAAARTQTHTRAVRALSAHVLAMDCAICLSQISPSQEAYLHPCFHFFCRRVSVAVGDVQGMCQAVL